MLTSLILGALVGAVLGLTGAGGGILAVPALVVGMGWPMQQASPVALIAVAGSAAIGAVEAFRRRLVRYRAALLMAITGVPVTSLGTSLAHRLPQRLLIELFSGVMLLVALRLLTQAMGHKRSEQTTSPFCVGRVDPDTGRLSWTWATGAALAGTGALTGLMTGLLGVGGGFIIVPMLRKLTNVSMHGIVATSLMVVAFGRQRRCPLRDRNRRGATARAHAFVQPHDSARDDRWARRIASPVRAACTDRLRRRACLRFVGDDGESLAPRLSNRAASSARAQVEPEVPANRAADDNSREPVAVIKRFCLLHRLILPPRRSST